MRTNPASVLTLIDPVTKAYTGSVGSWGGTRWADGAPAFTGCTTILGPGKGNFLNNTWDGSDGIFEPDSRHTGGVHVMMGDGSVRFISENIDTGNSSCAVPDAATNQMNCPGQVRMGPSPYGVWGALGSAAAGDLASGL